MYNDGTEAEIRVIPADTKERVRGAKALCEEYARSLGFDLDFQDFDEEMASFPGSYSPPAGRLLVAVVGERMVGCVALRKLGPDVCEMKRLYVKPKFRRRRIGLALAQAVIAEARRIGYARMRLDAIRSMTEAVALYGSLGFVEIPSYRDNPIDGAMFMELILEPGNGQGRKNETC
ncbi:MAG: GNAT family N-acetyltransferase [Candidatus Latescibacterota bacterium]|nr:MAG: GNAT family N-acetyltransferase [Candidatus Latescibacterota bacterium]